AREAGFDAYVVTQHAGQEVNSPDTLYTYWTDPNNLTANPCHKTFFPTAEDGGECVPLLPGGGFPDYTTVPDPRAPLVRGVNFPTSAVSPPYDEFKSWCSAADAITDPNFVALCGSEWTVGSVDPNNCVEGVTATQQGHINEFYGANPDWPCASGGVHVCPTEEQVYAHAAQWNGLAYKAHPKLRADRMDDPESAGCSNLDISYKPFSSEFPAGFDQDRMPVVESGAKNFFRRDAVLELLRRGYRVGIATGSDAHHRPCDVGVFRLPATDAPVTIVYAQNLTRSDLISALKDRLTFASMGYLDQPPDVRFWVQDDCPTPMGGTVRPKTIPLNLRAEVWQDPMIAQIRPASRSIQQISIVGFSAAGESSPVVRHTCSMSSPGVGCSCTNDVTTHGCSIDVGIAASDGPLWVEAYAPDGKLILWSTAIYVNHCSYIQATGSGVPCESLTPLPLLPYTPAALREAYGAEMP
ncbi:MAG: hypothetical protein V3T24_01260, partial [Longimicrobiales bacterium]